MGFFTALGVDPRHLIFSSDTSEEQGRQYGKGRGTVDCCYPVKCIAGHYGELIFGQREKLDVLFSPMIYNLPSFMSVGPLPNDVQAMLTRLIDHLKTANITAMLTSLTPGLTDLERTETTISSLMDTWILLRTIEDGGRRHRGLYVLKARGMPHSNELRPYRITDRGIQLARRSLGPLKRRTR